MSESRQKIEHYIFLITILAGLITTLSGIIAVVGWIADIPVFTTFGLGSIPMRPNMALCFALIGISILLIQWDSYIARHLIRIIALVILSAGALTIAEYLDIFDISIDSVIPGVTGDVHIIRMSMLSAAGLVLFGLSFFIITIKSDILKRIADAFLAVIFAIGLFDSICFILDLDYTNAYYAYNTASFFTSFLFMATSLGLLYFKLRKIGFNLGAEKNLVLGLVMAGTFVALVTIHVRLRIFYTRDTQESVERTIRVQHYINKLEADVIDVQTGVRGYLISDDKKYLEPYEAAKIEIQPILDSLYLLIPENNTLHPALVRLEDLVSRRIEYAEKMIMVKDRFGSDSASLLFETGFGKLLTDSIRIMVNAIDNAEHQNYIRRESDDIKMERRWERLVSFNLVIQVLLLGAILRITVRSIRRQKKSIEDIQMLNRELESRVEQRTLDLRQSEQKYKYLFEKSPLPMFIFDLETLMILEVNGSAIRHYGFSKEEFLKLTMRDIRPPEDVGDLLVYMHNNRDEAFHRRLVRHIRKDGSIIHVEIFSHPLEMNGRMARLAISNDITIKKIAEDEIWKANETLEERIKERTSQLEAASRAKSDFLANMSHEIRTPMNAILGYSELLGSILTEKDQKEYLNSIKASGRSLLTLINDILDLSKIEAGRFELEYEYIDTIAFFREFERIFAFKISEKGLRFITEISEDVPPYLFIDGARLRQIILNLAGNAVKFTEKGSVLVSVSSANKRRMITSDDISEDINDIKVEVRDTGIGIPEEYQAEIFESFVQVKNRGSRGGTGLGLAISRRLVQLMNGSINLESRLGEGSTFTVVIPGIRYRISYEIMGIIPEVNPDDIAFEKATLLVADDVEENRRLIRDALRNTELVILEANDGIEALDIVQRTIPELVISDIRMPGLNGFELLDKIKSDESLKKIPVLAYSASVMKEQKERIAQSQFAGLLIKPVRISDLYYALMNSLKYKSVHHAPSVKAFNEAESDNEIEDIILLADSLEGEFASRCKAFELRQPLHEVKNFGESLILLGLRHNCRQISEYGKEIVAAADSFNIEVMLKLLRKYDEKKSIVISGLKET